MLFVSHDRYFVNRVADHLIIFEPGRVRVIEGNYEAYQLFLQSKSGAPAAEPQQAATRGKSPAAERTQSKQHAKSHGKHASGKSAATAARKEAGAGKEGGGKKPDGKHGGIETGTVQHKKNRRFPFRKLSDIEGEIFQRESRLEQLNEELVDQATFRDGSRVRAIKQELADQRSALKKLYEHWDEASEMNW